MLLNGCRFPRIHPRLLALFTLASLSFAWCAPAQPSPPASTDKPPAFEVVAIKLTDPDRHGQNWHGAYDRLTIQNYTLRHLIRVAYDLKSDSQVLSGPDWIGKQGFDISAKLEDADASGLHNYLERKTAMNRMLQTMLADRFHLQVTPSERTMPVYALVVVKSGAKLTALPAPKDSDELKNRSHSMNTNNGHLTAGAISMDSFADYLTLQPETDRIVVNRTGLSGDFDFKLNWTGDWGGGIPGDAADPGLFTALQDQLGLVLKPDKGSVPVVTVVAASKPDLD